MVLLLNSSFFKKFLFKAVYHIQNSLLLAFTQIIAEKQQINALFLRHGKMFDGKCSWTERHMQWLRKVEFTNVIVRETLDEYLVTLGQLNDKVEHLDKRIEGFSRMDNYAEKVRKLVCFKETKTHTAMSLIVEKSDFQRTAVCRVSWSSSWGTLQLRLLPQAFHHQSWQHPSAPADDRGGKQL